jgi:hypothetical protein
MKTLKEIAMVFHWMWREWPRACGFLLGVWFASVVLYAVMFVVLQQLIAGVGTLPPGVSP